MTRRRYHLPLALGQVIIADFQNALIAAVAAVTHIAPADPDGTIIGARGPFGPSGGFGPRGSWEFDWGGGGGLLAPEARQPAVLHPLGGQLHLPAGRRAAREVHRDDLVVL